MRPKPERVRMLQIVANMHVSQTQTPDPDPAEYMKNQSILIAGCKEVCARFRIRWVFVELRSRELGISRNRAALDLCNMVMVKGRIPKHKACNGKGCLNCLSTGIGVLWKSDK